MKTKYKAQKMKYKEQFNRFYHIEQYGHYIFITIERMVLYSKHCESGICKYKHIQFYTCTLPKNRPENLVNIFIKVL